MPKQVTPRSIGPRKPVGRRRGLLAPLVHADGGVSTTRDAVMVRAGQALETILSETSERRMIEALSQTTGVDVLIHLISDPGAMAMAAAQTDDPLRAARARAIGQHQALLRQEGGTIGVVEVAERLRLTRGGVDARRKAGKLLAIEGGSRTVAYPVWQFSDHDVLAGLEDVLAAFTITDAMMKVGFFLSRDPDLGERPLDALRDGRVEVAREAASRFGRFGDEG